MSAACAATHARSCQKIHLDIRTALRSAGGLVRVCREATMPDKDGLLSGFLKLSQSVNMCLYASTGGSLTGYHYVSYDFSVKGPASQQQRIWTYGLVITGNEEYALHE